MRNMGQNRKRDANEGQIVDALEAAGAYVLRISGKGCPDLLVKYRTNWYPMEVKSKTGTLTEAQQERDVYAFIPVVRNEQEALQVIGAVK